MSATEGFAKVLRAYSLGSRPGRASWRYDAATSLPQTERRAVEVAQADGIVRASFACQSWAAGVADAAAELRELVTIHDNGGTASSPRKIKKAARELLRLLGEGDR